MRGKEYLSWGYNSTQTPTTADGACEWLLPRDEFEEMKRYAFGPDRETLGELTYGVRGGKGGLHLMAKTDDNFCIITNYVAENFSSIYISHMPEYESIKKSRADAQFLYNCFKYLTNQNFTISLKHHCLNTISQSLKDKDVLNPERVETLPTDIRERIYSTAKLSGNYNDVVLQELFGTPKMPPGLENEDFDTEMLLEM